MPFIEFSFLPLSLYIHLAYPNSFFAFLTYFPFLLWIPINLSSNEGYSERIRSISIFIFSFSCSKLLFQLSIRTGWMFEWSSGMWWRIMVFVKLLLLFVCVGERVKLSVRSIGDWLTIPEEKLKVGEEENKLFPGSPLRLLTKRLLLRLFSISISVILAICPIVLLRVFGVSIYCPWSSDCY